MCPSLLLEGGTSCRRRLRRGVWRVRISSNRRWCPFLRVSVNTHGVESLGIHYDKDCVLADGHWFAPDPQTLCAWHSTRPYCESWHPLQQSIGQERFAWPLRPCYCGYCDLTGRPVTFLLLRAEIISAACLCSSNWYVTLPYSWRSFMRMKGMASALKILSLCSILL